MSQTTVYRTLQAGAIAITSSYGYIQWRNNEIKVIKLDALKLLKIGYIIIDSPVSTAEKHKAWLNILKPHMLQHYKSKFPLFDMNDQSTWPQPANGKAYQLTSHDDKLPYLPKLITNNYKVQAIVCYIVDPDMSNINFGHQTHKKLLFLISPLCYLLGLENYNRYKSMTLLDVINLLLGRNTSITNSSTDSSNKASDSGIELEGTDQSYHLVNIVNNKYGKIGKPLPWATHIDGGDNNIYYRSGLPALYPPPSASDAAEVLSPEERVLLTLIHQLSILFHCETPGDLGPEQGVTGFYPSSHLYLLRGLHYIMTNEPPHPTTTQFQQHAQSVRLLGQDLAHTITQTTLQENKQLLAFGFTMHTAMYAKRLMNDMDIRVIQNCKIKFNRRIRTNHALQYAVLQHIPEHSLLRVMARGDVSEWQAVLGLSEWEAREVEERAKLYAMRCRVEAAPVS